jgi:hypothetical protein
MKAKHSKAAQPDKQVILTLLARRLFGGFANKVHISERLPYT